MTGYIVKIVYMTRTLVLNFPTLEKAQAYELTLHTTIADPNVKWIILKA